MTEYVLTLIGVSTVISVICMVVPRKSLKYTRLICSLCLLCIILKPLPSLLDGELFSVLEFEDNDASSESFYVEIYNNTIKEANEERIAQGLESMMLKDLGLPSESFSVMVEIDDSSGDIVVKHTIVSLNEGAVSYDPRSIVSYLEKMLDCSCEIIYYNS